MPLSFPGSPSVGQQSTQNGRTFSWTGYAWELVAASGSGSLPSTITGSLSVAGDDQFGSVSLLLHGDSLVDSSSAARAVTAYGSASVSGTPKFGAGSILLANDGDYLAVPSSSAFTFGTSDFAIEAWLYPTSYPADNAGGYLSTFLSRQAPLDHCWRFDLIGTATSFTSLSFTGMPDNGAGQTVSASYSFSLNQWYHVAVSRVSGVLYLFVNGVLQNAGGTSFTTNVKDSSAEVRVGRLGFDATYRYQYFGRIDEVRITKGSGRGYTSTFTAPTEAYPNSAPYTLGNVTLTVSS